MTSRVGVTTWYSDISSEEKSSELLQILKAKLAFDEQMKENRREEELRIWEEQQRQRREDDRVRREQERSQREDEERKEDRRLTREELDLRRRETELREKKDEAERKERDYFFKLLAEKFT